MLEKYKAKSIKILIGSDSGIAAKGEYAGESFSGMIIVTGVLNDYDESYIELKNSEILYSNMHSVKAIGCNEPAIIKETVTSMIINRNKIISIMLM